VLKLIQVGITICDHDGNFPPDIATWQFNLKFDLTADQYSNESIALLSNSGINFESLAHNGIPLDIFGEYLITSGLLLNDDVYWVSFHGAYDFAYLLKVITGLPLPENETTFFECLKLYFPHYFDIRYLVRYVDNLRGSLSKLGQELNINRIGIQHQAGSDSILTSEIFFRLKSDYFSTEFLRSDKNVLFGFGAGEDTEYLYGTNYFGFNSVNTVNPIVNNINALNNMNINNMSNPIFTQKVNSTANPHFTNTEFPNNYYSQNIMALPYNYMQTRGNNTNAYYPQNTPTFNSINMNTYHYAYSQGNMNYSNFNVPMVNNTNSLNGEDKKKVFPAKLREE